MHACHDGWPHIGAASSCARLASGERSNACSHCWMSQTGNTSILAVKLGRNGGRLHPVASLSMASCGRKQRGAAYGQACKLGKHRDVTAAHCRKLCQA